ncbi:MAG: glycosyltransferase family 2 protein [Myxococcales bacterium]|nr:glycosyltransferase family 2 protein [Myxococcales bacterium]
MTDVKLSVIAPCFNEEHNVATLVQRTLATFKAMGIVGELVLIDDGSRDRTWERITEAMQKHPEVRGVRHLKNRGIEGGWLSGLDNSSADVICLIDSDLQNRPEDIERLWETYQREPVDIVQAVRHPQGLERRRLVFSSTLNAILNISFGTHLRDSKSGFVICRREVFRLILDHKFKYRYFQSFIGAAAGVRQFTVAEVDTTFEQRRAGQSFLAGFPVKAVVRIVWELAKFRVETLTDPRHKERPRTSRY